MRDAGVIRLYHCSSSSFVGVRRIREQARVRSLPVTSVQGWNQFYSSKYSFTFMIGLPKEGMWFFFQNVNGSALIVENESPMGQIIPRNDPRWFEHLQPIHSGRQVIRHVATQTYIVVADNGKITFTPDPELASEMCIHIQ